MREPEDHHGREDYVAAEKKNPPSAVREAQENGLYLLAHSEPHDPCPVAGCSRDTRRESALLPRD